MPKNQLKNSLMLSNIQAMFTFQLLSHKQYLSKSGHKHSHTLYLVYRYFKNLCILGLPVLFHLCHIFIDDTSQSQ